ncbi:MAG: hypothetical protein ABSG80_14790 [Verrucomicrobiota bacterium]|jgi:hypothetical protein
MTRRIFPVLLVALLAAGAKAQAQGISITVIPALAPNAYGSPNWNAWVSNATTALINGYSACGDPSSPSYYQQAPAVISVTNDIVTGFPSWNSVADPGDVFGANYSQELGNRIQFGIDIKGGTNLISISQLSFSAHSTDASNSLDFAFDQGSYNYSASYIGIIYGPGGTNTYITSGPATQLVNEIVGRGSGNAWDTYDTSGNIASQQSNIDLLISQLGNQPFNFTGTYTIAGVSASGSVTFNPAGTDSGPVLGTGGISIAVYPALAPNRWGSPSWNAWASNAVTAILNGYSSCGDPSLPSYYQQITGAVPVTNNLVTSFPSWMGVADPGTVFGPNFANESGNRLTFGMDIKGGTNLISIAQLSFIMASTDPGNTLDWSYSPIPYSYSGLNTGSANPVYLGIIYGPNGQRTYVTNGPATQLVNEIVTCGSGNAWWPDGTSADSIAVQQSNILACAEQVGTQTFSFTGTYVIDGVTGSNAVTFNPVVPPAPPATAGPLLSIALVDPPDSPALDNAFVSWPAASGYVLQTNADLTTTNWGDYLGTVDSANGINSVTLHKTGGSLFFRLRH